MNRISEDVTRVRVYLGPPGDVYHQPVGALRDVHRLRLHADTELTLWTLLPLPLMSLVIASVSDTVPIGGQRTCQKQRAP
ncbi:MAG: hypothetical protein IPL77_10260 [Flavobacteriales bacterium]|nr:hypothetical protein [Flavobacteriales bacterium]